MASSAERGSGSGPCTSRSTPPPQDGRPVFHVFAALAEFIRELIVQGTNESLAAARSRGQRLGRPPAMSAEQIRQARALLTQPENTVSSIGRLLGVSRSTIYKYIPELSTPKKSLPDPMKGQLELTSTEPESVTESANSMRCPTCRSEPASASERRQQRQDLELVWLYLQDGQLLTRRHCQQCQPHQDIDTISCPLCGDGPMLAGADLIQQTEPPGQLTAWLQEEGWTQNAEAGLYLPQTRLA